jgi:hypothetical protein
MARSQRERLGHPAGLEDRVAAISRSRVRRRSGSAALCAARARVARRARSRTARQAGAVQGVLDDLEQPLVLGEEQLLLVGEVAEEGPPGDLGRGRDLVDGRPLEPALGEQLEAGGHDGRLRPVPVPRWPWCWHDSGCR